jgi:hypothetical protein
VGVRVGVAVATNEQAAPSSCFYRLPYVPCQLVLLPEGYKGHVYIPLGEGHGQRATLLAGAAHDQGHFTFQPHCVFLFLRRGIGAGQDLVGAVLPPVACLPAQRLLFTPLCTHFACHSFSALWPEKGWMLAAHFGPCPQWAPAARPFRLRTSLNISLVRLSDWPPYGNIPGYTMWI